MLNSNIRNTLTKQSCDPGGFTGQNWNGGKITEADSFLVKKEVLIIRITVSWKRDGSPISY